MKTEQCIKNTAPTIIAKNNKILLLIGQIFTGTKLHIKIVSKLIYIASFSAFVQPQFCLFKNWKSI